MKKVKALKNAHASNSKIGSGDFYGTGVKQKIGTVQRSYLDASSSPRKLGKAPKSLA